MKSRILFSDAVAFPAKDRHARRFIRKRVGDISIVYHVRMDGNTLVCSVGIAEKIKGQPASENRLP